MYTHNNSNTFTIVSHMCIALDFRWYIDYQHFYLLTEFQAIDSGENNLLNTKDFEPQNVHTNPIPIANVHKIESEEQFHTPDSKTTQENLDNLETLLHSPHEIVQIESSGKNAK